MTTKYDIHRKLGRLVKPLPNRRCRAVEPPMILDYWNSLMHLYGCTAPCFRRKCMARPTHEQGTNGGCLKRDPCSEDRRDLRTHPHQLCQHDQGSHAFCKQHDVAQMKAHGIRGTAQVYWEYYGWLRHFWWLLDSLVWQGWLMSIVLNDETDQYGVIILHVNLFYFLTVQSAFYNCRLKWLPMTTEYASRKLATTVRTPTIQSTWRRHNSRRRLEQQPRSIQEQSEMAAMLFALSVFNYYHTFWSRWIPILQTPLFESIRFKPSQRRCHSRYDFKSSTKSWVQSSYML